MYTVDLHAEVDVDAAGKPKSFVSSIDAIDPATVRITLNRPNAPLLQTLAMGNFAFSSPTAVELWTLLTVVALLVFRRVRHLVVLTGRKEVYEEAKRNRPDRWSGQVRNWEPIGEVVLNPGGRASSSRDAQLSA